jgi:uncharacterized ubiquitin-like protein YukD
MICIQLPLFLKATVDLSHWLCDKLSVRIGDKQNRLLCNKSLYYKLQVRCQQVKEAGVL